MATYVLEGFHMIKWSRFELYISSCLFYTPLLRDNINRSLGGGRKKDQKQKLTQDII